jgi:sulfoxide reductase catalytic subunit YedY
MKTRRQFNKIIFGFFTGFSLMFTPFLSLVRWGIAKTKKFVLPKDTKRETLIEKNPAQLDTRNLEITALEDFGTMGPTDHEVDLDEWRLEITGHTRNPLGLTYQEITALPWIEREVLLICPGVFANHGRWKGISIKELLERAGWKKDATHVTVRGPKNILSDKVFLAYQVNGEILPQKHGFPLRLVAEGYYGYEWIKYVHSITVEKIAPSS